MNQFLIDTDAGIDDAHAILLASAYPGIVIVAFTTVAGNVSLERVNRNVLCVKELLGLTAPVYPGCAKALVLPSPRRAISHGIDGLGDSGFPDPSGSPQTEHAALALIRLANESPGELTLVALGPLTNIALAICLEPDLPSKFKRLVVMGGAIQGMGNSWRPAAEFNIYLDPEAAAVVFQRWTGLTLVSWETTLGLALNRKQVETFASTGTKRADFFSRTMQQRLNAQPDPEARFYEPDPVAMAVALEPSIVLREQSRSVQVELAGELSRGQTVVDWYALNGQPPNVHLALEVNSVRFLELFQTGLQ